jgi:formate-dependent nitrite reductase membrane component NrfD
VPAGLAGAGLATYTASLLSATSTPLWAAAPRALAVRFAASAVASAAAALALGERSRRRRGDLDAIALAALAAELAATDAARRGYRARGVAGALTSDWGRADALGAEGLGAWLPLGLLAAAAVRGRPAPALASLAIMAGSTVLRVAVLGAGAASATDPGSTFHLTGSPAWPPAAAAARDGSSAPGRP